MSKTETKLKYRVEQIIEIIDAKTGEVITRKEVNGDGLHPDTDKSRHS